MYTISRGFAIQGMRRFPFVLDRFKLRLKLYLDKRVLEPLETQLARTFVVTVVRRRRRGLSRWSRVVKRA